MDTKLPLSNVELARRLRVTPQAVSKWPQVPVERVLEVSEACNWRPTPHEIRPDIYPHPDDGLPAGLRGTSTIRETALS